MPLLSGAPPLCVEALPQYFGSRTSLSATPNGLWQIKAGFVRSLTWLEDGNQTVLGIWGPGDVTGKLLSQANPYQLECITKVEAIFLSSSGLTPSPEVLLAHIHQLETLMQIRSHRRVDVMVLKFLGWLGTRFGQDVEAGKMIDLRLTHQDIAEAIGATRVTVTRTLNQLEQQGMIQRRSLQRIILREEELWHYEI
jgi:CRP-like cAMP-binding protein